MDLPMLMSGSHKWSRRKFESPYYPVKRCGSLMKCCKWLSWLGNQRTAADVMEWRCCHDMTSAIDVQKLARWSGRKVDDTSRTSCCQWRKLCCSSVTYIQINKFLTRPTCQITSESGALRWRQKQSWVARFKQFSFKPVLKCQKCK